MKKKKSNYTRRDFLKTAGIAGMGSVVAPVAGRLNAAETNGTIATRPFGKTGQEVSILSLGGMFDIESNHLMLKQAINWGVTYWDTAHSYGGGRSEIGIGKYFAKYPQDRQKIFLVTKSGAWSIKGMTRELDESLERMQTDYVDLFFVHAISSISEMDADTRAWAEKAKAAGKIRLFGFSTHSNMEGCLQGAPKLGWIDGIMMTYNYRTMAGDQLKAAVEACAKAGIGLTAMKTQAKLPREMPSSRPESVSKERWEAAKIFVAQGKLENPSAPPNELAIKLTERFRKKGFSMEQAKLNVIWENPHIASICSAMYNMTVLTQNVAAAAGKVKLSRKDKDLLSLYAVQSAHQYCAGCTRFCQYGAEKDLPIGVVMRSLMYARDYGDRDLGKTTFRSLPSRVRRAIERTDYAEAEKRCPNGLPIGRLMREAAAELA